MANRAHTAEIQHDDALGWRWGVFGWAGGRDVVASKWFASQQEAMDDLTEFTASIGGSVLAA